MFVSVRLTVFTSTTYEINLILTLNPSRRQKNENVTVRRVLLEYVMMFPTKTL